LEKKQNFFMFGKENLSCALSINRTGTGVFEIKKNEKSIKIGFIYHS